MNILIVSFDKNLVNKLKKLLADHNVVDVKNGEEAINTVSSYMDVVIYDAVSGSISEEDINNMYKQKFKDPKYIILVDDLFPIDINNVIPPKKVKLMREEVEEKILSLLTEQPAEEEMVTLIPEEESEISIPEEQTEISIPEEIQAPIEVGGTFEEELFPQEVSVEEGFGFRELDLGTISKKLLLVSFDTPLINNLRKALSDKVEIVEARNIKEILEKAKEADVILFDTISGTLAYRTLVDMSKDDLLAKKPYILLVDELFAIDVASIPLENKYTFARESELSKAVQKIMELIGETALELPSEEVLKQQPLEEAIYTEPQPISSQEEETSIMNLLEEIISSHIEEEKPPVSIEEEPTPTVFVEEPTPEVQRLEQPVASESTIPIENIVENLATAIKDTFREQMSQERLYSTISNILNPEDISKHLASVLEKKLEEVLREMVSEIISRVDVSQIVREEAYKVLRERINELIT